MIPLSREALALLLRLLNSPTTVIAGDVLIDQFASVADELINGGYLQPAGIIESLAAEDGGFHELTWCSQTRAYCYFSTDAGWVTVPGERLQRYRVDDNRLLDWLTQFLGISAAYRVSMLNESIFWHLGISRFGNHRVNLYFVRRLEDSRNMPSFLTALKRESARTPTMIISASTFIPPTLAMPLDQVIIPLEHLLSRSGDACVLDYATVQSLLQSHPVDEVREGSIGLRFSTDYRQVHWNGKAYTLTKKQAAVVEALHQEGGRAHKDLLRAAANTNEKLSRIMSNRIEGKWATHPFWGTLIKSEGNGYYSLDN